MRTFFTRPTLLAALCAVGALAVSCASTKQTTTTQAPAKTAEQAQPTTGLASIEEIMTKRARALQSLRAEGSMSVKLKALNQRVSFDGGIYKRDSLLLNIYGPLGITVGKLQSTPSFAQFYYALTNTLYEGAPTRENFERRVFIPISYGEIVTFLRGEIPGGASGFKPVPHNVQGELAFVRQNDSTVERVLFSTVEEALVEYQMKRIKTGEQLISLRYSNFTTTAGIRVAQNYVANFPAQEASLQAQCNAVEANAPDQRYSFTPSPAAERKSF